MKGDLVGIEIEFQGRRKFIGKVGVAPAGSHPVVEGCRIFYREAPWVQVYSHTTNTVGVDRHALDAARKLGAEAMVTYLTDSKALLVVVMAWFDKAPVVDLGERPQYRIPSEWATIYAGADPVSMGWTTRTHLAEAIIGNHAEIIPIRREPVSRGASRIGTVSLFTGLTGDIG